MLNARPVARQNFRSMSLVLHGHKVDVPGLDSVDFVDDPRFRLSKSGYRFRTKGTWIRGVVLHTRMGVWPTRVSDKRVSRNWDKVVADRWANSGRMAGAHIAIDSDGSYACLADITDDVTFHAGQVNPYTVGIEMYQEPDGTIYVPTLMACVEIVDILTRELSIQRQMPTTAQISKRFASANIHAPKDKKSLACLPGGKSGRDFVGVYGHRNCTRNRGKGDPGDDIWSMLAVMGYEAYDVDTDDDRRVWKKRQKDMGLSNSLCDGIPGIGTVNRLRQIGKPYGLWVQRPCDVVFDKD